MPVGPHTLISECPSMSNHIEMAPEEVSEQLTSMQMGGAGGPHPPGHVSGRLSPPGLNPLWGLWTCHGPSRRRQTGP